MVVNESYIECTLYRTSKHMEQKLREMKREIDKYTFVLVRLLHSCVTNL